MATLPDSTPIGGIRLALAGTSWQFEAAHPEALDALAHRALGALAPEAASDAYGLPDLAFPPHVAQVAVLAHAYRQHPARCAQP